MPKIHLILLAGSDNRYPYLRDTIDLCGRHFESVILVDTGSTDDTVRLDVNYIILDNWKDDWKLAYEVGMRQVDLGDWFLFMDSDERPSQLLLDHMQADVAVMEKAQAGLGRLPGVLHWDGQPVTGSAGGIDTLLDLWPKNHAEYLAKDCWTKQIFIQRQPGTHAQAFGGHCGFYQDNDRFVFFPHYYNHYKSKSQLDAGIVRCAWSCIESHDVRPGSPEYIAHNQLREKTGIMTANDLDFAIRTKSVPQEFLDLWRGWGPPHHHTLVHFYNYAFKYDFKIDLALQECTHDCCVYRR